jgi:hypothetical protein
MDTRVDFIKPPAPRHRLVTLPDGIAIHIPARRQILALLFLPVWLVGWGFGEISVIRQLLNPSNTEPAAFLIVWLVAWTAGGAFALLTILWQLAGREIVSVTGMMLQVRRDVFGIGYNRRYDVSQVRFLRLAPVPYNPRDLRSATAQWGLSGGPIAFDYGSRTVRVGAGLDEAEARVVLEKLVERAPMLAERNAA